MTHESLRVLVAIAAHVTTFAAVVAALAGYAIEAIMLVVVACGWLMFDGALETHGR